MPKEIFLFLKISEQWGGDVNTVVMKKSPWTSEYLETLGRNIKCRLHTLNRRTRFGQNLTNGHRQGIDLCRHFVFFPGSFNVLFPPHYNNHYFRLSSARDDQNHGVSTVLEPLSPKWFDIHVGEWDSLEDLNFFLFCWALQDSYLPVVRLETLHTIHTVQVYYTRISKSSNVDFTVYSTAFH